MEPIEDRQLYQKFKDLVRNFLTRNKEFPMKTFIGGLPITLESKDVSKITKVNENGKGVYNVTQKVDGTRYLMYIGPKIEPDITRIVCFIDRNMKFFRLRNSKNQTLQNIDTKGEILLDGELVFFKADGTSHKYLNSQDIAGVSFMAFDILFGPREVIFKDDKMELGQHVSMMLPSDEKSRVSVPWTYIQRYDILYNLISIPKNEYQRSICEKLKKDCTFPLLQAAFKDVPWFNVEIKPIYNVKDISTSLDLYTAEKNGYLQRLFRSDRRNFYAEIEYFFGKSAEVFVNPIELDGLIFTSYDTLYKIGSWNSFGTEQYKWKPNDQQTVDLRIKIRNQMSAIVLYRGRDGEQPWRRRDNNEPIVVRVPDISYDGKIGEFKVVSPTNFVFKELRSDKTSPNALYTVLNVVKSILNPVDINDLYYFFNLDNTENLKKVLKYSPKEKLINCIAKNDKIETVTEKQAKEIKEIIDTVGSSVDNEVELRLGVITEGRVFNTDIRKEDWMTFFQILQKNYNFSSSIEDLVDLYNDLAGRKIRSRYQWNSTFSKYLHLATILKRRKDKVDVQLRQFGGFDLRFARSTEEPFDQTVEEGPAYRKYRINFTHPEKLYRFDLTATTIGTFKDNTFTQTDLKTENFQIEIELLTNKVTLDEILKLLLDIYSKKF
jgi:hypothetical protein